MRIFSRQRGMSVLIPQTLVSPNATRRPIIEKKPVKLIGVKVVAEDFRVVKEEPNFIVGTR